MPALEVAKGKEWECEDTDPPAVALLVVPCAPVNVGAVLVVFPLAEPVVPAVPVNFGADSLVIPKVPVKDGFVPVVSPSTVILVDLVVYSLVELVE